MLSVGYLPAVKQVIAMLRQQQAEIEALKEKLIMEEESYILLDEECLFAKEAIKLHQAEIEALKKEAALQRLSDFTQEADNEPVAWMQVHYEDGKPTKFSKVQTWEDDVPLYTHPAKTLTDEEIDKLWHSDEFYEEWTDGSISAIHYNKFARAILRKANEK